MNRVTITKYSDMKQIAGNVARTMIDLNEKCKWHWSSNTGNEIANTGVHQLVVVLSYVLAIPISTVCFPTVHLNAILQSPFLSSYWLPSMKSPRQNSVYILGHPTLYVIHTPVVYITLAMLGNLCISLFYK